MLFMRIRLLLLDYHQYTIVSRTCQEAGRHGASVRADLLYVQTQFFPSKRKSEPILYEEKVRIILVWWSIGDSNSWPPQCHCGALPTALMPRNKNDYSIKVFACKPPKWKKSKVIPHKWGSVDVDEFCAGCNCKNRGFTGRKSRFLQAADRVKFAADIAAELCGIAFIQIRR